MSDTYSAERYEPKVGACVSPTAEKFDGKSPTGAPATIELTFDGTVLKATGAMTGSWLAVSGKPTGGKFDYSPRNQAQKNTGPIPAGDYWIQPSELWEEAWYRRGDPAAWGNYRITIHPYPTTPTGGRGGFFIHGGDVPGSAGCIDLTKNMDHFVEALKKALNGKTDCYIKLTVRYL